MALASSFLRQTSAFRQRPEMSMKDVGDSTITGSRLADLPLIIDFIEAECERTLVRSEARFDLQVSVEEACTNIIEHAYKKAGGRFTVCFQVRDRDVVVTVRDRGKAFDPCLVPKPDFLVPLRDRPLGGLGLYLMQRLMDEVSFGFSETEGNVLVMVKRDIVEHPPANDSIRQAGDG
jgi:anti-sigma regulatory factor (Ser/Thr protein kinase)